MPSVRDETSGSTTSGPLRPSTSTASSKPGGARRRPPIANHGISSWSPIRLNSGALDCLGGAGHLAAAKAAIVLVLGEPEAERYLTIDQYDLGQATMAMMLAATDLGIGSGHSAIGDQDACRRILGVPDDRTALTCWHSATRRTARSDESRTPTDGPSTTSSTGELVARPRVRARVRR